MGFVTVFPDGTGSHVFPTGTWSDIDEYADASSANDSDSVSTTVENDYAYYTIEDMPGDFGDATSLTIKIRHRTGTTKGDPIKFNSIAIYAADETAVLSSTASMSPTQVMTTYEHNLDLSGDTSVTAWDGAKVYIGTNSGSESVALISALQIDIGYSDSTGGDGTTHNVDATGGIVVAGLSTLSGGQVIEITRPTSNVNTLWNPYDYTLIDDPVTSPTVGDGTSCFVDNPNLEQIWGLSQPGTLTTITSAKIHAYIYNDAGSHEVACRLNIGGEWTASDNITASGSQLTWDNSIDFTGEWTAADFTSAQVGLDSGGIGGPDEIELDVLYVELTGSDAALPANTYDEDATGGSIVSGAGEENVIYHQDTDGGGVPDGTGYVSLNVNNVAGGGVTVNGAGGAFAIYNLDSTGGCVVAGVAVDDQSETFDEDTTGGVVVAGETDASYIVNDIADGGVVVAGESSIHVIYTIDCSGGAVATGAADYVKLVPEIATGGAVANGTSLGNHVANVDSSGGCAVAGAAIDGGTVTVYPDGGVVAGGLSLVTVNFMYVPTGGMTLSGSSLDGVSLTHTPTGGMTFNGAAPTMLELSFVPGLPVFDNGYFHRKRVEIPWATFSETLTNFPVLVDVVLNDQPHTLTFASDDGVTIGGTAGVISSAFTAGTSGGMTFIDPNALTYTPSGGMTIAAKQKTAYGNGRGDVLITDKFGNELPFEIELFNAVSGRLLAWVQLPTVGIEETELYVYFGSDAAVTPSNPWAYEAVYHLNDEIDNTTSLIDSGQNGIDGVGSVTSTFQPKVVGGQVHNCLTFGGNDFIRTETDNINNVDDVTVDCWVKPTALNVPLSNRQVIFTRGLVDEDNGYDWSLCLGYENDGRVFAAVQTGAGFTITEVIGSTNLDLSWHHVAVVWESGSSLKVYVDGVLDGTTTTSETTFVSYSGANQIGRRQLGEYLRACLDELRISRAARSAAWIAATYQSINFATAFQQEHALHIGSNPTVSVDRSVVPTGGMTIEGTAPSQVETVEYIPDGNMTIGGTSPVRINANQSGGMTIGGAAITAIETMVFVTSGGMTISGDPTTEIDGYTLPVSGGMTLSGTSPIKRGYVPTGGMRLRGSHTLGVAMSFTGTGGMSMGGAAIQPDITEGGGMTMGGTAPTTMDINATLTGNRRLTLSGTSPINRGYLGGGLLRLRGSHTLTVDATFETSGGMTMGGAAIQPDITEGGGMTMGGSADVSIDLRPTLTGNRRMTIGGTAPIKRGYVPTGGMRLRGNTSPTFDINVTVTGGMTMGGIIPLNRLHTPTGGMTLGGAPEVLAHISISGFGGMVIDGAGELSTFYVTPIGGMTIGGEVIEGERHYSYIPTGGMRFLKPIFTQLGGRIVITSTLRGDVGVAGNVGGNVGVEGTLAGAIDI